MPDAAGAGGTTHPRRLSRQPVANQPDATDRRLVAALHPECAVWRPYPKGYRSPAGATQRSGTGLGKADAAGTPAGICRPVQHRPRHLQRRAGSRGTATGAGRTAWRDELSQRHELEYAAGGTERQPEQAAGAAGATSRKGPLAATAGSGKSTTTRA